jgi:hypothetical protein
MRSLVAVGALLMVVLAGPSHAGDGDGVAARRLPTRVLGRALLQSPVGREFLQGSIRTASVPGEPAAETSTGPGPLDPTVSIGCGTFAGTRFNREASTGAVPQFPDGIDFFQDGAGAGVDLVVGLFGDARILFGDGFESYAVSRDASCGPEFEGALPELDDPLHPGNPLASVGGGAVAVDPVRDTVFAASVYDAGATTGIGLFRSTRATLLSGVACPNGLHNSTAAKTCWPTRRLVGYLSNSTGQVEVPHIAVDEKAGGTGAGTVYIAYPRDDFSPTFRRRIFFQACTNNLVTCTPPQLLSGSTEFAEGPHVAVRPVVGAIDPGYVTITWLDFDVFPAAIRYRSCPPVTPPTTPACGPIRTVAVLELNEVAVTAGGIPINPFPKHDHRQEGSTIETYVVWTRCKTNVAQAVCPDTDIVMKASNNDGATWSGPACVDCSQQDQFGPGIRTDRARGIVNVAYYSSVADPTLQHRTQLKLAHIPLGSALPDGVEHHSLTTLQNDLTAGGAVIGLFLIVESGGGLDISSTEVAARSHGTDGTSRTYVHHLSNHVQGNYSGNLAPEANNYLSRLDY